MEFYKDKIEELEAEIAQLKKANANQTNTKNREAQVLIYIITNSECNWNWF